MITGTTAREAENLLELQSITKAYRLEAREFVAIQNIDLYVKPGEFVCLLGPSGCGKSTLLRIIAGLSAATSGVVCYHGRPLEGVNPYTTIVFQTFALYPWLTVLENVEIALKARGVPPAERRQRALKLIDTVGLDGFESAYPRELSGGMRQKVGFARAMAVEPELLCLDEPFSALDVLSAEALRGELMELWLKKRIPTKAILMVTHNIEEAVLMADRIVIMGKDPGHIVTEIPITLRQPRRRKDTAFQALVDKVYAAVAGPSRPKDEALGTRPGQPGVTRPLPNAQLSALTGLLEKLVDEGGRVDLFRISEDLVLELDDLLPIVESGDLLGFISVREGDLLLTPLGRAYADATILGRKAIIAGRVLRLPTIAWIYETLQQDDDRRVAWEYFHDQLQADFGERAEKQLDIAISWGRHAELFAYDDAAGELYLESDDGEAAKKSIAVGELYEAWPVLSLRERVDGFLLLQQEDAENFFLHLSARDKAELILALPVGERRLWTRLLGPEEALDVVQEIPEHERAGFLSLLDDKTRREVKGLMDYVEEQARGSINPRYARLRPDMSVDEAVSFLRRDARDRAETVYYAYVTDPEERLLGTVSFRDLLVAPGDKKVQDVMRTDVISAPEHLDRKALSDLFARYNLRMIPVVDSERRIKKVVTRDDLGDLA
ncbi:MAG TPA: AAA-associated domain-containing protein [candidate division Zixibacteria bacterium]|nr:AAA-associated domain-containing protein [candidate division Zixibacteria bacterium]